MIKIQRLCLFLIMITGLIACTKEAEDDSLNDLRSTLITDLAGDTGASMGEGAEGKENRPFYIFLFRFRDQRQIWIRNASDSAQWLQTADWDIAFTGPYNSEIFVNDGTYEYNPGFGGPARSAVVMIDRPYRQVTEAPDQVTFDASDITKIGWASSDNSPGWFFYSLNTHIMQAVKNRTYVLRLPSGQFAKLELLNAYQGNPPVVTDMNWPAPYFTFRYYVQEDGSRDLNTN